MEIKVIAQDVESSRSVFWLLEECDADEFAESLADAGYTLVSVEHTAEWLADCEQFRV